MAATAGPRQAGVQSSARKKENVLSYPRPPALEQTSRHLRVLLSGGSALMAPGFRMGVGSLPRRQRTPATSTCCMTIPWTLLAE